MANPRWRYSLFREKAPFDISSEKNGEIEPMLQGSEKQKMQMSMTFAPFGPRNRHFWPKGTKRAKSPDWLAEGVGFEPTRPFWGLTVFKTAGFNHSPTPPKSELLYCNLRPRRVTARYRLSPATFRWLCQFDPHSSFSCCRLGHSQQVMAHTSRSDPFAILVVK
jgi:hypothetical protein